MSPRGHKATSSATIADVQADTDTTPLGHGSPRVGARTRTRPGAFDPTRPDPTPSPFPPSSQIDGEGKGDLIELLTSRDVRQPNAAALVDEFAARQVTDAVAWFDQQSGVGAGLLVTAIRQGRTPRRKAVSSIERNREYADAVCRWLLEQFPELERSGRPHPAAITCVLRLHQRDGKGSLTRGRHGDEIRAAVAAFDLLYPSAYMDGRAA